MLQCTHTCGHTHTCVDVHTDYTRACSRRQTYPVRWTRPSRPSLPPSIRTIELDVQEHVFVGMQAIIYICSFSTDKSTVPAPERSGSSFVRTVGWKVYSNETILLINELDNSIKTMAGRLHCDEGTFITSRIYFRKIRIQKKDFLLDRCSKASTEQYNYMTV